MTTTKQDSGPAPTVADAIVSALRAYGVDRLFCVAGESYLPLLDALLDAHDIDVVTCRHEGSAGFAAIADAKLSGRPGVCLVSRGPGAANAVVAAQAAMHDATPLLLLAGQVPRSQVGRDAFQEFDPIALLGGVTKRTWAVPDGARAGEFLHRALRLAISGTPGAVALAIPQDVFGDPAAAMPLLVREMSAGPDPGAVARTLELLDRAERPLLMAGGRLSTVDGRQALAEAARSFGIPVVCTNKNQDLFDNRDPCYAGHLHNATPAAQRAAFDEADLILAVGTRLDCVTTAGFRWPAAPRPRQPLVHVYPDPGRLAERYRTELAVCAEPSSFLRALAGTAPESLRPHWQAWTSSLHAIERDKAQWTATSAPDGIAFGAVAAVLDRLTGGEVTVTVDSGGFTSWLYRYLRLTGRGRLLGLASSTMGFAVPAAAAAALREPGRPALAVVGDGGFGMNGSELATAVARGLRVVVLVVNNGSYGTIRHHQERAYPGRVVGTDLVNPDFAALGEAYGALGLTVSAVDAIEPALTKALDHPGPVVVDVHTSLSHFSAYHRLGDGASA